MNEISVLKTKIEENHIRKIRIAKTLNPGRLRRSTDGQSTGGSVY